MKVLEAWEAQQGSEPSFEPEENQIGDGWLVRVTWPDGEKGSIYNDFKTKAAAVKWIRSEAVVWLWERRNLQRQTA